MLALGHWNSAGGWGWGKLRETCSELEISHQHKTTPTSLLRKPSRVVRDTGVLPRSLWMCADCPTGNDYLEEIKAYSLTRKGLAVLIRALCAEPLSTSPKKDLAKLHDLQIGREEGFRTHTFAREKNRARTSAQPKGKVK